MLIEPGDNTLELRVPPLIQMLLVGFGMYFLSKLAPSFSLSIPGSIPVGLVVILMGAIVAIVGVLEFRKAGTTVDPRFPEKSENLVVAGIYKISRNPMYVGFFLCLSGWALILSNLAAVLLLPMFVIYINHFQIKPEERFLLQKFGSDFSQYCDNVRRWI